MVAACLPSGPRLWGVRRAVVSALTIVHLSDLHLSQPALSGRSLAHPKRLLAYLSWRLKRRARFDQEAFGAVARDVQDQHPDGIVITGDLTQLGLPSEYDQVREWLLSLGPPDRVSLVPGNHDFTCAERPSETLDRWEPWIGSPVADGDRFPTVREIREGLALIGVSSARPSWPTLAVGTVGEGQLGRLESALETLGRSGRFRVLFLHHPPCGGIVGWRKRLTDATALRSVIDHHGVELVLHGHAHRPLFNWLSARGRRVPVIGAASVSETCPAKGRTPRYNAYRITPTDAGWDLEVTVRAWSPSEHRFDSEETRRLFVPTDPGDGREGSSEELGVRE